MSLMRWVVRAASVLCVCRCAVLAVTVSRDAIEDGYFRSTSGPPRVVSPSGSSSFSARSAVDCARTCRRDQACFSFAFHSSSRLCFLNLTSGPAEPSNGLSPSDGSTGLSVSSGSTGLTASDGSTGISAYGGSTGLSASDGSTGLSAPDGSTGMSPSDGSTGMSPSDGSTGLSASDGSTGLSPSDGSTGLSPSDGSTAQLHLRIFQLAAPPPSPPLCPASDLDSIANAAYVILQQSSVAVTPLYAANVTCDADFMLGDGVSGAEVGGSDHKAVQLECWPSTALWQPAPSLVQCRQSVWRSPAIPGITRLVFPRNIPTSSTDSWSMCLRGRSPFTQPFSVGIWNELNPVIISPVRAYFDFGQQLIRLQYKVGTAEWAGGDPAGYPMPSTLQPDTEFLVKMTALGEHLVKVAVDGLDIGQLHTPFFNLSQSVGAGFMGPYTPVNVDLWC